MINRPNFSEVLKIGIVVGIFAILLAGFLMLKLKKVNITQVAVSPSPTIAVSGNQFYFNPKESIVSVGNQFKVDIYFHADGKIITGADIALHFDPSFVDVLEIKTSDYFREYPRKTIDQQKGTVKMTAFRPKTETAPQGSILFATLDLKAKKIGNTQLKFDFQKGTTNLTTLVQKGTSKNILDGVGEAKIEIK